MKKKFGSNFGSNFGSTLKKSAIGSIRRPNMANFKQKIKNRLKKGQSLKTTVGARHTCNPGREGVVNGRVLRCHCGWFDLGLIYR